MPVEHRNRADDVLSPALLDPFTELPDLWWPQDRAWWVGGDVDLVGTHAGGPEELITELLTAPGPEAHRVEAGDTVG